MGKISSIWCYRQPSGTWGALPSVILDERGGKSIFTQFTALPVTSHAMAKLEFDVKMVVSDLSHVPYKTGVMFVKLKTAKKGFSYATQRWVCPGRVSAIDLMDMIYS